MYFQIYFPPRLPFVHLLIRNSKRVLQERYNAHCQYKYLLFCLFYEHHHPLQAYTTLSQNFPLYRAKSGERTSVLYRAVFTWLSKGIGFGFGFGFTTPFGWLVYLLWFWFYDSQVKTALILLNLAIAIALGSKPPLVTRIARTGLGTRLCSSA